VGNGDAHFILQSDGEEKEGKEAKPYVAQFRMLKYFVYPYYE